jgi:hypothetical protein
VILAVRSNRNNPARAEGLAQRFTVIAFVQPQAFGFTFALADTKAIKGCQDRPLVVPGGCSDSEVERRPMRLDEEGALEAANAVFAGVPDLRRGPFFDLMTLAS